MPLILGTNSIKDTGYDVANSLRFDSGSSSYLYRSTGVTTTNTKFTLSFWIKLCDTANYQQIFEVYKSANERIDCGFNLDNSNEPRFFIQEYTGSYIYRKIFTRLSRDVAAWTHYVIKFDSSESEANRLRVYINGVEETATDTVNLPSSGATSIVSVGTQHIGYSQNNSGHYLNGYLAEFVLIEGTDYDPTSFGEFDSDSPTIWKPKDVSGLTFGTNGFYLDFENNQTAFIDSSSNARAITVSGNTNHSFTQAKFNESSIYFDGTNDSLDIADSSDFDFGTGNFTFEFWVYKTGSGKMAIFETRPNGGNDHGFNLEFDASNKFSWYDASISGTLPTDPNAITLNTWTHYACVRNGTTFTMYKNGTSVGTPLTGDSSSQSSDGTPTIGESSAGSNDFQGYLDEIRLSNTARYTGNFTAPTSPFTSDSDTVLLIQSKASNLIGADVSGQGNHFSSSGLTSTDQSTDTCTNNFTTLNSLANLTGSPTFSEGNLKVAGDSSANHNWQTTFVVSSGKWYWELKDLTSSPDGSLLFYDQSISSGSHPGYGFVLNTKKKVIDGSPTGSAIGSSAQNDIWSMALDLDNGKMFIARNGTYLESGNPSTGANPFIQTSDGLPSEGVFGGHIYGGSMELNFGSPPYSISSGNSDANGFGNFEYSVPSGYFSLCSKNLAEFG